MMKSVTLPNSKTFIHANHINVSLNQAVGKRQNILFLQQLINRQQDRCLESKILNEMVQNLATFCL